MNVYCIINIDPSIINIPSILVYYLAVNRNNEEFPSPVCFMFTFLIDIWLRNFWKWTHFSNYLLFLCLFTLISGLCTYLLSSSQIYIQLLGFTALFIESMLGLPQFTKNYYNKSIVGMR